MIYTDSDEKDRFRVLLMERSILRGVTAENAITIRELRHPRTNTGSMFAFSADASIIQEIFTFSREKKSWFINDSVAENGLLYLSTPVDPCFLVLPYLKKANDSGKVIPLTDLLVDDAFPETLELLKCSGMKNINLLADRKGNEDLNAWTYNEEKVLGWLTQKAERVAKVLKEKNIQLRGSTSTRFLMSKEDEMDCGTDCYLSYACGLISEYLTDELSSKLYSHLHVSPDDVDNKLSNKRKSAESQEMTAVKKIKNECPHSGKIEKLNKSSAAKDRSKIKVPSGCKSITSFFKKK